MARGTARQPLHYGGDVDGLHLSSLLYLFLNFYHAISNVPDFVTFYNIYLFLGTESSWKQAKNLTEELSRQYHQGKLQTFYYVVLCMHNAVTLCLSLGNILGLSSSAAGWHTDKLFVEGPFPFGVGSQYYIGDIDWCAVFILSVLFVTS